MAEDRDEDLYGPEAVEEAAKVRAALAAPVAAEPPLTEAAIAAGAKGLAGLEKFAQGAVVAPQGRAGIGDYLPLVRRMAAVGLIATFTLLSPNDEAKAWGRPVGAGYGQSSMGAAIQAHRERRREIRQERQNTFLAAGVGIVGGLVLGGALGGGNRGYAQPAPVYGGGYGGYNNNYGGYGGYRPPVGYGAYGPPAGYGGYRQAPSAYDYGRPSGMAPSDAFTLAAKTLIAARIGSVEEADRIYDRFLNQAANCTRQLGPSSQCIVRFQEVSLDLARGEFIAAQGGQPVVVERMGRLARLRPDILQDALAEAKRIKVSEMGGMRPY